LPESAAGFNAFPRPAVGKTDTVATGLWPVSVRIAINNR
jgi:hypothetical protein